MYNLGVRINYLYNSGFYIELEKHILIFDYYLDDTFEGKKGINYGSIGYDDLKNEKELLVFSSHSHSDHYNPIIFNWKSINSRIKYILSSDIKPSIEQQEVCFMKAYDEMNVGEVKIHAFGSTDIGISFYIEVEGIKIFHAGDLNWWHWWDCTLEENKTAEAQFKKEIDLIKDFKIDIAFFPVDSRLREDYRMGGDYFIKNLKPQYFIPMHFREDYASIAKFKSEQAHSFTSIITIEHRGQTILL